ncbi:MAG: glutamate 5-kinase [Tissierellia bacterium]|nr:glutamate 5-kinase [Tissierellia bacterium]
MERNTISNSKKIVIKIGSSTITSEDGTIDKKFLENLASQVKTLMDMGKEIVIVSSGARIAGVGTLGKWSRKEDIHYKQALCAIGQVELMDSYRKIFGSHGLHVGQLLLTKEDFNHESRTLNIRNTLFTLLDEGVVPIINENDTVCVEEIKIGDNDMLAAYTTVLWGGDLLIMLSDIEGIYTKNPQNNEDARLIEVIENIEEIENSISQDGKSSFGTGGIATKILAAKKVTKYGTNVIVAKGKKENIVLKLLNGEEKGTLFLSKRN